MIDLKLTNLKNLIIIIVNFNLKNFLDLLLVQFTSHINFVIRFDLYFDYLYSNFKVLEFLIILILDLMVLDLLLKLFINLGFIFKF